jgi:hypothetical protein
MLNSSPKKPKTEDVVMKVIMTLFYFARFIVLVGAKW